MTLLNCYRDDGVFFVWLLLVFVLLNQSQIIWSGSLTFYIYWNCSDDLADLTGVLMFY